MRLFLWEKAAVGAREPLGTILFVHGSSMGSQPTFDFQVPGGPTRRPWTTSPVWATTRGASTWRATGGRTSTATSTRHRHGRRRSRGRDGLHRPDPRRQRVPDVRHLVGRARGRRCSPSAIRSASCAWRSTPSSGPRKPDARRAAQAPAGVPAKNRRPIDRAFVRSIFTRDHPGTADDDVIEADAILALDDSVPTGTYVDMCANLPVVDPARIPCPRSSCGASTTASPGRPPGVLPAAAEPRQAVRDHAGIAHASFHQKNYGSPTTSSTRSSASPPRSTAGREGTAMHAARSLATVALLLLRRPPAPRPAGSPGPVDMAAAKRRAVSWYTSTPIVAAQKVANLFQAETGIKVELFRPAGRRSSGASCRRSTPSVSSTCSPSPTRRRSTR